MKQSAFGKAEPGSSHDPVNRIFLVVLDSVGAGAQPDAADFSDEGSNTLLSVFKSGLLHIPNLVSMGIGNIDGLGFLGQTDAPTAAVGRLCELSRGKDTTTGHWEIAGIVSEKPMPLFPNGFPARITDEFTRRTGKKILCNRPCSGTRVIMEYGRQHQRTGDLIVYTSADSVFQIAAHEKTVPVGELYEYCRIAREILSGDDAVGRVIARPFDGEYPDYFRTSARRDFSLEPPSETLLDRLCKSGLDVISVGKINDIFAGRGITQVVEAHTNPEGEQKLSELVSTDFRGLCFVNLVDFDMLYGHRNDPVGYAAALSEFDSRLSEILSRLKNGDVLIITADHGCDPGDISTDHTREYVPVLVAGEGIKPVNLGTRSGFCDIAASVSEMFKLKKCYGNSFYEEVSG